MQGLHLTADLHNCRCDLAWLTDATRMGDWCLQAARSAGLQPVNQLFHVFPDTPQGLGRVTVTVLMVELHLSLHTWPLHKAVTLDVHAWPAGGDPSAKAKMLMQMLLAHFAPQWTEQRSLDRGEES